MKCLCRSSDALSTLGLHFKNPDLLGKSDTGQEVRKSFFLLYQMNITTGRADCCSTLITAKKKGPVFSVTDRIASAGMWWALFSAVNNLEYSGFVGFSHWGWDFKGRRTFKTTLYSICKIREMMISYEPDTEIIGNVSITLHPHPTPLNYRSVPVVAYCRAKICQSRNLC